MAKQRAKSKNPILVEFAKKIRNCRHNLDFTQEELAEKAGFHVNFIGGIERATRNPSLTSIIRLAKALKISPDELIPK